MVGEALQWLKNQPEAPEKIRGPIQGHFFQSYRVKLNPGENPFYGEPLTNDIQQHLWERCGFAPIENWHTLRFPVPQTKAYFEERWNRVKSRWEKQNVRIRPVHLADWENELRTLYRLVTDSFSYMPNFAPIDWPSFLRLYEQMKYLIRPEFCLLAESEDGAEGFVVALPDPLPILTALQERTKRHPRFTPLWRAITLYRLKKNRNRLLVLYAGKRSGSKAPWLTLAMGHELAKAASKSGYQTGDICYVGEGSPAYVGLPFEHEKVASYTLFEKSL